MREVLRITLAAAILVAPAILRADDVRSVERMLCTSVQVAACVDGGDCFLDVPANLNVPQFIEVDLTAKSLRTTKASGEDRSTTIEHLKREGGTIVIQGVERDRAYSIVIHEETGALTAAVARDGYAVSVFGACTPAVTAP